jgi:hypothetical protein
MALYCRLPTDEDIWQLGEFMRQSDRDELAAVCDLSAYEAVLASVRASDPAFLAARVDGLNRVDVRQVRVIAWLGRLGFEFAEAAVWRQGFPLWRFEMGG